MNVEQLIFVGLNGYALALDRETGEIVWSNDQMKSGYVTLLLDGDRLIVRQIERASRHLRAGGRGVQVLAERVDVDQIADRWVASVVDQRQPSGCR